MEYWNADYSWKYVFALANHWLLADSLMALFFFYSYLNNFLY